MNGDSGSLTPDPKFTPTMQKLVEWMRGRPDRSVHRHPGGYWREKDPFYRTGSFGTSTVQAVVDRGVAEWVEWQEGRSGRFPIQARLV